MTESFFSPCPECGSPDTTGQDLLRDANEETVYVETMCVCLECGHVWRQPLLRLILPPASSSSS